MDSRADRGHEPSRGGGCARGHRRGHLRGGREPVLGWGHRRGNSCLQGWSPGSLRAHWSSMCWLRSFPVGGRRTWRLADPAWAKVYTSARQCSVPVGDLVRQAPVPRSSCCSRSRSCRRIGRNDGTDCFREFGDVVRDCRIVVWRGMIDIGYWMAHMNHMGRRVLPLVQSVSATTSMYGGARIGEWSAGDE